MNTLVIYRRTVTPLIVATLDAVELILTVEESLDIIELPTLAVNDIDNLDRNEEDPIFGNAVILGIRILSEERKKALGLPATKPLREWGTLKKQTRFRADGGELHVGDLPKVSEGYFNFDLQSALKESLAEMEKRGDHFIVFAGDITDGPAYDPFEDEANDCSSENHM